MLEVADIGVTGLTLAGLQVWSEKGHLGPASLLTQLLSTLKTEGSLCGVRAAEQQVICQLTVDAWVNAANRNRWDHPISRGPDSSWEFF